MANKNETTRTFTLHVLGRTLWHLGVQMYKRRDAAIAELVANSWDAGATKVAIVVPEGSEYDQDSSVITITDDGCGMLPDEVQDDYLVVGRNRRSAGALEPPGRPVMGRKGIGKLAGFGVAEKIEILTWRKGQSTSLTLDAKQLKSTTDDVRKVMIPGALGPAPHAASETGTNLVLQGLKHSTSLDVVKLRESLARRFSRRVQGAMTISVNLVTIGDPNLTLDYRYPKDGMETVTLSDGREVRYCYAFAEETIKSTELRGFNVLVRGKTAQAPPFFFEVESTASGQHATRYVTGTIEADFLDEGSDDESDIVSTDRQEIEWDADVAVPLYAWGQKMCRDVLREWTERRGNKVNNWVEQDEEFQTRLAVLDQPSRRRIAGFIRTIAQVETNTERTRFLVDSLIRAFEFRQFHDFTNQLDKAADDPDSLHDLLVKLGEWKVLESRAVLEIVKGRLAIIDKFSKMLVANAPETAPKAGADNLHDLLAAYPWLLNPEWQVLSEEKRITTQLREWLGEEVDEKERGRYDFLALADNATLVVVEIKRSGHSVELEELQRLERYKERLSQAHLNIRMVLVCGGSFNVTRSTLQSWQEREDGDIWAWGYVFTRARNHYEHWRSVLEGDVGHTSFAAKEVEVAQTRKILDSGTAYRGPGQRKLGPQDMRAGLPDAPPPESGAEEAPETEVDA